MANRQSHPILAPSALRYDIGANLIGDIETPDSRNCSWQDGRDIRVWGPICRFPVTWSACITSRCSRGPDI